MKLRRSRLSNRQSERLLEHFVAGTTARAAAEVAGVNRNTARLFYHRLRTIIARHLEQAYPLASELEIDVLCPGGAAEREHGHGGTGKTPVFGIHRRGGMIHTVIAPGVARETPPAAQTRIRPDSIVYTNAPELPRVLDVSGFRHERIGDRNCAVQARVQIDSIENFWSQAKRQLRRYGGIPRRHLHLFLKECEWRFNYGSPKNLLKILKHWIKTDSNRSPSMPAP